MRLRQSSPWQQLAWKHYDAIGEVKYAFNYFANALSRVRFYAAYSPDDRDGPPVPIGSVGNLDRNVVTAARYEVAKLDTAHGGQPGLIRAAGLNLAVAGECYLIEYPAGQFGIYSTNEIRVQGARSRTSSGVQIVPSRMALQTDWIDLPQDAFIARIWRPHPAYSDEADSSLLGVRDNCEELIMLSRLIRASAMSQINAGILYVADELSFVRADDATADQPADDPDHPETDADTDVFQEELELTMTEPIDDDLSPASVLPMVVRGPADMAENAIKKFDLTRPFDDKAIQLRENALERVLNGLDIPKDLVTGLSNVRYSNAQQISENLYKAHVEPTAVLLCEAITVTRLRPALIARGIDPGRVARVTVWYDASEVVTAANRAQDADAGHDRNLISDAAWRRDHGYSEADKPNDDELARRLAQATPVDPATAMQMMAALIPVISEMIKSHAISLPPTGPPAGPPALDVSATPPSDNGAASGAGDDAEAAYINSLDAPTGGGGGAPADSSPASPPPEGTPAPAGVVGAAHSKPKPIAQGDTQRLLDIERRLRASLQTMLTDMTERALEKAGSRLVSKYRDKPDAAQIRHLPKTQVAAALGREAVVAAGYTDQLLVQDSVNQAESKWKQQIIQAHAQAARVLGQSLVDHGDIDASWGVLKPMLVAYMLRAMFRKRDDAYVPKVPMDDVRAALARAGGAQPKAPAREGKPQPGAVLSARALEALATKHDAEVGHYRWVYGISDNHFKPHLDLDGKEFSGWDDPVLKNPGTWPKTEHLYPGDHGGCECDWLSVMYPKQPHEGRVGEHVGEISAVA